MAKRRLMMLGPPGAGKGTQAQRLARELEIPQISTGDMLRGAKKKGTPMGKKAAQYMDQGELVPDEVVIGIVEESLSDPEVAGGFILDGFPRTLEQAEALDDMDVELDAVLNIQVSKEEVITRLGGRRVCLDCGATYHTEYDPPQVEGVCDECGGEDVVRRADDEPDKIANRFEDYEQKTQPLIEFYRKRGRLLDVDGERSPDQVYEAIVAEIE